MAFDGKHQKGVKNMKCDVSDCDGAVRYKKNHLCGKHYLRLIRHGDVHYKKKNSHGEGTTEKTGYRRFLKNGVFKREHVLVAEKALGKKLPYAAVVHHVNYDKGDNNPSNLIICQDEKYHSLLYIRTDALNACGNSNYRKCTFCKQFDDTRNMLVAAKGVNSFVHSLCRAKACIEWRTIQASLRGIK